MFGGQIDRWVEGAPNNPNSGSKKASEGPMRIKLPVITHYCAWIGVGADGGPEHIRIFE